MHSYFQFSIMTYTTLRIVGAPKNIAVSASWAPHCLSTIHNYTFCCHRASTPLVDLLDHPQAIVMRFLHFWALVARLPY